MEIGIFSWFGFPMPPADCARLLRQTGYRSVMLWWADDHADVNGPKELQPERFRAEGLRIDNMHTPFADSSSLWLDNLRGQTMEDLLSACLDDCGRYGIPTAVVHLTEGRNPPPPSAVGLGRVARLTEKAERLGVTIALENLRYPQYLDHVFAAIASDRLRFCYDSGHENCRCPDRDLLAQYGGKLAALHLHDNDGSDDQHLLPFDGTVPWARVAAHLKRLNYRGDLTLEIDKFHGNNPDYTAQAFLEEGMLRARRLLRMIEQA